MQTFQIASNEAGQRLDKFLHKYMPNAGNGFLYKMLRKKNITLNGKKAVGNEILAVGDTVSFFLSENTLLTMRGMGFHTGCIKAPAADYELAYETLKGISVLYETEDILAVCKPAGILSQKADKADCSLNEWVVGYLLRKGKLTAEELKTFKPSVANRLDRNTSGLVLCGISLQGSRQLSELLKSHRLKKYYLAVAAGRITEPAHLKSFLKKDDANNLVSLVSEDEGGVPIETAYRPLVSGNYAGRDMTLLEVELITGKSHQIRAHLAFLGHPLIGDGKYGNIRENDFFRRTLSVKHQLLHAYRVVFPREPDLKELSGKEIIAPVLGDMEGVLKHGNMELAGLKRLHP